MMRFVGQPILISGAGRGLGEGIARHLAAEGAIVGIADIHGDSARAAAAAIVADGGRAFAYAADCGSRADFLDMAGQFAADAGWAITANKPKPTRAFTKRDTLDIHDTGKY